MKKDVLYRGMFILSLGVQTLFGSSSDQFPEWDCPLSELKERGNDLEAHNSAKAESLRELICKRAEKNRKISSLTKLDARKSKFAKMAGNHPPFDYNRLIPKDNPQLYLNASVVRTKEQDFLLAGCPVFSKQVAELFMHLLSGKASRRVWVSVLDASEKPDFCNNFWRPKFVKKLRLRDDWKLIKGFSTEIAEGKNLSAKGTKTSLIKTVLVFSNGSKKKTVNHLHYTGWFDRCRCPDQDLFLKLLDEMDELNKQENKKISSSRTPIVINCIGGVGRTGMVAIGYMCREKMRSCPKENLDKMTINIPKIIFALRKQRPKIAKNKEHLIALHTFLGEYYERLRGI